MPFRTATLRRALAEPSLSSAAIIAFNVARLRYSHSLGQDELAMRLGWPRADIEALEDAALDRLALDDIDRIAGAFGVAPVELMTIPL